MTWLTIIGGAFLVWLLFVFLFAPHINYQVRDRVPLDSPAFLHTLQATCQAAVHEGNRIEILTNGDQFYPAMLDAIGAAQRTINLEHYIFLPGEIAGQFIDALVERARAGVVVTIVVDAIGSATLFGEPLSRLKEAGCRVESYQRVRWYSLARLNNRTHREIVVIDGRIAFLGGAGIADWWWTRHKGHARWRDTMARIEGPIVAAIQGVFAENWLECCGEILTGDDYFPRLEPAGNTLAFVVKSSPADRATVSRVTFQLLMEGAARELRICTPYFLPDRSLRRALVTIVQRGVSVKIIVPGEKTDQRWVRLASRRMWGQLLEAGVRIFEYQPGMTHVKVLLVDERWAVIGTTNIDNRSFEHNDEINIAACDPELVARLDRDFERDLADSREIRLEDWRRRPILERAIAPIVWILERQQ